MTTYFVTGATGFLGNAWSRAYCGVLRPQPSTFS
jgi:thioester reductase-like protein